MRKQPVAFAVAVAGLSGTAAIAACGGAHDDSPPGVAEGTFVALDRPVQPGEKGCGRKIVCDDGNPCTADSCVRGEGCVFAPLTGAACNDGNACTQTDTCTAGTCTGSNPILCNAEDACHIAGTCDPSTGTCSNPTLPVGTTCDDGNACTFGDACNASGVCSGDPVSCASDACNTRACNGTSSCTVTPQPGLGYYVAADGSCTACGCDLGSFTSSTGFQYAPGAQSAACDATGACTCLAGFTGAKCDGLAAAWDLAVEPGNVTMIWDQSSGEDKWSIPVPLEDLGQNAVAAWTSCQMGGTYFAPIQAGTLRPGEVVGTSQSPSANLATFVGPRSALPAGSPQVATCSISSFITAGVNDQDTADKSAQVTVSFPDSPTFPSHADIAIIVLAPFECSSLVSLDSYQYSPPVAGQAVCINLYISVDNVAVSWQLSCTVDGATQTVTVPATTYSYSFYPGEDPMTGEDLFNFGALGPGTHSISCTADSGNNVIETNRANNTESVTITL